MYKDSSSLLTAISLCTQQYNDVEGRRQRWSRTSLHTTFGAVNFKSGTGSRWTSDVLKSSLLLLTIDTFSAKETFHMLNNFFMVKSLVNSLY